MSKMDPYTKQIHDALGEHKDGLIPLPRIDYYEFRDKWLPLFTANAHDGLAPLGEWVQAVARGNPFLAVQVVRDGQTVADPLYSNMGNPDMPPLTTVIGGTVMFTVPQILNNSIKTKMKDGQSIDHIAIEGNEIGRRLAKAGDNYLKKNMVNNFEVAEITDLTLSKQMDDIFLHFGVKRQVFGKPSTNSTEAPKPIDQPTTSLNNDDLDFDF